MGFLILGAHLLEAQLRAATTTLVQPKKGSTSKPAVISRLVAWSIIRRMGVRLASTGAKCTADWLVPSDTTSCVGESAGADPSMRGGGGDGGGGGGEGSGGDGGGGDGGGGGGGGGNGEGKGGSSEGRGGGETSLVGT